ncbi:MAG: NAD(P)/FAD-dependent oxidoreductase [Pseudomonadales bacterium]|nr:NAD(P)/FAD-dependent oxidoreductase [Pseudomonadales bacterium]MCP5183746.1 NAD(P)/FAD-dependent oxidoreductase [Pseudomonadales bacterium]
MARADGGSVGTSLPTATTVLIIGAGPGGLCAGIALAAAGITDFVILEKASGVGGTWWHNRYPGAECDVKSHLYSFSFAPKADWSRPYAGQPEILTYVQSVAEQHGMLPYCRFGCEVIAMRWDETAASWRVSLRDGESLTARVVISGIGMFNDIAVPDIPGLESFQGTVFHTARWPSDHDLTGERVAIIGSAASAVQTAPEIAPIVARLDLYQRTPQWVLPKQDAPYSQAELARFQTDPEAVAELRAALWQELESAILFDNPEMLASAERAARENINAVNDADLRRRLTPDWRYGCRRPLLSNLYYPMFNRDNVHLRDRGIRRIEANGIVTGDGEFLETDTIILATGFETTRFLSCLDVTGRNGLHISDAWADGAMAYRGITTAGFPNLFMLYGPNTNNNSLITMLELEAAYAVRHIVRLLSGNFGSLDVTPAAMAAYNTQLQKDIARITVWRDDCRGYYRAASGRNVTQFPYTMTQYEGMLREPDDVAYTWA